MTSLPQTQQRTCPAREGRCRTWPAVSRTPEALGSPKGRARQSLPAVDPSMAYGCVDWFLYPDPKPTQETGRIITS